MLSKFSTTDLPIEIGKANKKAAIKIFSLLTTTATNKAIKPEIPIITCTVERDSVLRITNKVTRTQAMITIISKKKERIALLEGSGTNLELKGFIGYFKSYADSLGLSLISFQRCDTVFVEES